MKFTDVEGCSVEIPSTWKEDAAELGKNAKCQTEPVKIRDASSQSIVKETFGTQTSWSGNNREEDEDRSRIREGKTMEDDDGDLNSEPEEWNLVDDEALAKFVVQISPMILSELSQASKTQVFFQLSGHERGADSGDQWSTLYKLKRPVDNIEEKDNLYCTGLCWNATGSQVIVGYGRFDNFGWCDHRGTICIWNIFARSARAPELSPDCQPDIRVEASSGVMCVAAHPTRPAVFAAGTFNGEILVFDTTKLDLGEDALLSNSHIEDYCHKEPVMQLNWIPDPRVTGRKFESTDQGSYLLASVGSDGRVLLWDTSFGIEAPLRGFQLATQGRSGKVLGGTALSFCYSDNSLTSNFIVGSEGGAVARCTLSGLSGKSHESENFSTGFDKWSKFALDILAQIPEKDRVVAQRNTEKYAASVDLHNIQPKDVYESCRGENFFFPNVVRFSFRSHHGPINSIAASPFNRRAFLTSGADGDLRLYSLLEKEPVLKWAPAKAGHFIYSSSWSPHRPAVFACTSSFGELMVFDLADSTSAPVLVVSVSGDQSQTRRAVFSHAFNCRTRGLIAVGDECGTVQIIKLGWTLSNRQSVDKSALDSLIHLESRG